MGIFLSAVCWQLSALLAARPGDAVGLGGLVMLALLALGWIALVVVASCMLHWRAE